MTRSALTLAHRLGLGDHVPEPEALQKRLRTTAKRAWTRLGRQGCLRPDAAAAPLLDPPDAFTEALVAALALEAREGGAASAQRTQTLLTHHLDTMPTLYVELMCTHSAHHDALLHAPLSPERTPRLARALDGLIDLLRDHGVDPEAVVGASSAASLLQQRPTIAALYRPAHFGASMPLLYALPGDIDAYRRELEHTQDPYAVIDRRLTAPILHELLHFGRRRAALQPPYLDECVAGYLGVLILPSFAWPESPDHDNALLASPWFVQVGQALVRAFGLTPIVQAQSGHIPWSEALPPALIDACERLGWSLYTAGREPHLLSGNTRPDPWLKLFAWAAHDPDHLAAFTASHDLTRAPYPPSTAPSDLTQDTRAVADALRSMCLHNTLDGSSYRVRLRLPGPIHVNPSQARLERSSTPDSLDPAPPRYALPPWLAQQLANTHPQGLTVRLDTLDAIDPLAAALVFGDLKSRSGAYSITCPT